MAKVSSLTALAGASLAAGDTLAVVDVSDTTQAGTGSTKKTTLDDLRLALGIQKVLLGTSAGANSTATGVKISGLDLTVGVGTFKFEYVIRYQNGATSTGIRFGVNHTGTAAVFAANLRYQESTTAASTGAASQAAAGGTLHGGASSRTKSTTTPNLATTISVDSANADMLAIVEGYIIVTVSGTLELWHASETTASSQVMAGTALILTPFG